MHDLVLAKGLSVEKVMNILARITNKVLVVEVPSVQDDYVRNTPNYYRYAKGITPDRYSLDKFIKEGQKYFENVSIYPSHPDTRTIIVFANKKENQKIAY